MSNGGTPIKSSGATVIIGGGSSASTLRTLARARTKLTVARPRTSEEARAEEIRRWNADVDARKAARKAGR